MAIDALLAIIAGGRQAIVVLLYFIDSDKNLRRRPLPTPCGEAPGGAVCSSIKTMPPEGKTAPS
jgi:hypothetical protein